MVSMAARPPATPLATRLRLVALPVIIGGLVFSVALVGGGYSLAVRDSLAIGIWWTIALALGLSIWPAQQIPWAAVVVGVAFVFLALLTALSLLWADSDERAFNEFNRVVLYLGVVVAALVVGSRANASRWRDGLAGGIVATGLLSLSSRLFVGSFPEPQMAELLMEGHTRLSYPLNYWNALAILIAVGCPLLLGSAVASERALTQAIALAPFPALAATVYLTASRTGTITVLLGLVVFVALTSRRWIAAGGLALAALGSAAAVYVLFERNELVNGPLDSQSAASQGRSAAVLITITCITTGILYAAGRRFAQRLPSPRARVGWAITGIVVALALAGIAAAQPVERVREFKELPIQTNAQAEDRIRDHLTSTSGNGRWQWWGSALDQFRANPVLGNGAGSYEAWWAEHGTIPSFVRDAHSLYLETMGELGLVGLVLLVTAFGTGIVTGARRLRRGDPEHRLTVAAFLAAFVAYAVAAGVDWMWELAAVTGVGMLCLGLIVGAATAPGHPDMRSGEARADGAGLRSSAAVAMVALAPFLIAAQAIPLLSTVKIRDSQRAFARGDIENALADAFSARKLQPWAATPHLQVALVEEATNDLPAARQAIVEAIERDPTDWRLWLVRVRLEAKAGAIAEARRSLARASALNPRSPLFADRGAR